MLQQSSAHRSLLLARPAAARRTARQVMVRAGTALEIPSKFSKV